MVAQRRISSRGKGCGKLGNHLIACAQVQRLRGRMRRVTLELPDEVLNRAERLAVLTHRDVADVLAEAVSAVLPPVDVTAEEAEISKLSDAAVLRLADASFFASEEDRLSLLLDKQQSGTLTHGERLDLLSLIRIYEASWLRQAEALAEAVRRGLREPLPS